MAGPDGPGQIARIAIRAACGVAAHAVGTEPAAALTGTGAHLAIDQLATAPEALVTGGRTTPIGRPICNRMAAPQVPSHVAGVAIAATAAATTDAVDTIRGKAISAVHARGAVGLSRSARGRRQSEIAGDAA